jgi:hypothetical protein
MEVHRAIPQYPGSYYRLSPGPRKKDCIWDPWDLIDADMLYIDWDAWELIMEPLIIGRVIDYDNHGKAEVGRRFWRPIIDDLERLHRVAKDLEYFNELYVEFGWEFNYANLADAERNFPQTKQEFLFALKEIREWIVETLKTHSVITFLGIRW